MKRLTIREIAKMAKVSPTAVSFVINNKEGVSSSTRNRVKKIILETGFVPNLSSKRLLLKKSFNICLLLGANSSPFEDLFYFEITKGILRKSNEFGYNIVIGEIKTHNNQKSRLPDIVYSNDTDGIMFFQDISNELLAEVKKTKIPFLVIDSHTANTCIPSINPDYELAAYTATKFLIDKGHSRIAFITSNYIKDFYKQTFLGFEKAMSEAKLKTPPEYIKTNAENEQSAYNCMKSILACSKLPTAVMCAVDMLAIGAMKCVKDNNLTVPNDISFIGIDDILLSSYTEPKLTTVKIDKLNMGSMAMELIIKLLNNDLITNIAIKPNEIIVRDSVCSIN